MQYHEVHVPLFQIIDQGTDVRKEAALLVQIRKKKMKKHQRKKWAKRMKYRLRTRRAHQGRKEEKKMKRLEKKFQTLASEFDAEKFVDERIELARKGGWGIDIWSERRKKLSREL